MVMVRTFNPDDTWQSEFVANLGTRDMERIALHLRWAARNHKVVEVLNVEDDIRESVEGLILQAAN